MGKIRRLIVCAGAFVLISLLCGFTDLPEEHWAYSAVNSLVESGTVKGFEDGSFRPDEPVTRAQFVKMLGYKGERRNDYISDIKRKHWAYEYLMYSPLRTVDNEIMPDKNATREEVAVYIYDCFANKVKTNAPSVVLENTVYKNEISWIYEKGIMVGDDGIHLRLSDNLTRAEAAVLIAGAKNKLAHEQGLADAVNGDMLENVFNNSGLFDSKYSADTILTNGEAACAAYRLQKGIFGNAFNNSEPGFVHKYANDLKAMEPVLGNGRISAEFADKAAEPEDAFSMFAFAMASKIHTPAGYGSIDGYYADAVLKSPSLNAPLTFACKNGIYPFSGGKLKTGEAVTHKSIAAVLLQYDMLYGLETSAVVNRNAVEYADEPMRYTDFPDNQALFKGILKSVPNGVYLKPMELAEGGAFIPPAENYSFFNDMREAFAGALKNYSSEIYEKCGAEVTFTFYPSLVYDTGNGFAVRCRIEGTNIRDVLPEAYEEGGFFWTDYKLPYMFFMSL